MKRHDSLIPLTHDHHHALAQARRLEQAADKDQAHRISQAGAFLDFFESDTLVHFREEEESIFPLVIDSLEARPPLTRLLLEHVQLHALVARLRTELADSDPSAVTMTRIASQLQEHIRFEEKVLFPLVELLALDTLASVELSPRERGPAVSAETRPSGLTDGGRTALTPARKLTQDN